MTQYDDNLQATAQMFDSILQAAKHLATKAIASDPDHEKVIRSFIEYQLDRDARIGAAKDRRETAAVSGPLSHPPPIQGLADRFG